MTEPSEINKVEAALVAKLLGRAGEPAIAGLPDELIAQYLAQDPATGEDEAHEPETELTPSLRAEPGDLDAEWSTDLESEIEAKLMRQLFGADEADEDDPILVRYVLNSATPEERRVVDAVRTFSPHVAAELADLQEAFESARRQQSIAPAQTDSSNLYLISNAPAKLNVEPAAPSVTAPPQASAEQQPKRQISKPQLFSRLVQVKWLVPAGVTAAAAMALLYFRAGGNSKPGADRLAMAEQKRLRDENSLLKMENNRLAVTAHDQRIARDRELAALKSNVTKLERRNRELIALNKSKAPVIAMETHTQGFDLGNSTVPHISGPMGKVSDEIELLYPVDIRIREDRPVLQWRRLPGIEFKSCTLNWFSVQHGKPEKNTPVAIQDQTQFRLPRLQRGQTYGWQIVMTSQDGKELDSKVAYFTILDTRTWDRWKRSGRQEQYRKDAEAYLKAGLLEDARRMIDMLDPDDDITHKLRQRLNAASKD